VNSLCVDYVVKRSFFGKPTNIFRAVDNLSFCLYQGETLGLVGESGCGKTTLGRSILGLTPYQGGSIRYRGKDIAFLRKAEMAVFRQDVQLVFQDPYSSLNPRHTIGEAIMEPIAFYAQGKGKKQLRHRAIELLEYVALPANSFYRYPHEFSGGQRQRVAIARALSVNPKVVVCDEMVSALDVSIQAQILNLLNRLKDEFGLTYIFISHDLSVVKYMSNRMIVMQNGQIVESGSADAIYSNPQSEYTKQLINSIPQL
jgi:peptide/nickel transport system ATP-binding protein